ncbi:hypothetical protein F5Y12DRAFT_732224 [Xylaria sp. FL1777]|nr:hypothetical protein F5Y12DRAFT_732224 [Xylaria sp. FL1777]
MRQSRKANVIQSYYALSTIVFVTAADIITIKVQYFWGLGYTCHLLLTSCSFWKAWFMTLWLTPPLSFMMWLSSIQDNSRIIPSSHRVPVSI